MNYLISDNVRILYLSCNKKKRKQFPYWLERAGTGVTLIVFYGIF